MKGVWLLGLNREGNLSSCLALLDHLLALWVVTCHVSTHICPAHDGEGCAKVHLSLVSATGEQQIHQLESLSFQFRILRLVKHRAYECTLVLYILIHFWASPGRWRIIILPSGTIWPHLAADGYHNWVSSANNALPFVTHSILHIFARDLLQLLMPLRPSL